jgi:hypothetical protein
MPVYFVVATVLRDTINVTNCILQMLFFFLNLNEPFNDLHFHMENNPRNLCYVSQVIRYFI